jgi:hypothetical protein
MRMSEFPTTLVLTLLTLLVAGFLAWRSDRINGIDADDRKRP